MNDARTLRCPRCKRDTRLEEWRRRKPIEIEGAGAGSIYAHACGYRKAISERRILLLRTTRLAGAGG